MKREAKRKKECEGKFERGSQRRKESDGKFEKERKGKERGREYKTPVKKRKRKQI